VAFASGLLVHGGGLYALNALRDVAIDPQVNLALVEAAKWHVAGIVFILIAGLMAWLNFQAAVLIYNQWANPLMVYKTDEMPTQESKRDVVGATRFVSIACGILALWAFIASAATVLPTLQASLTTNTLSASHEPKILPHRR
jgi:hypothetical protein